MNGSDSKLKIAPGVRTAYLLHEQSCSLFSSSPIAFVFSQHDERRTMERVARLLALSVLAEVVSATQFSNVSSDDFPGAPQTCLDAVNGDISCMGYLAAAKDQSWTLQLSSAALDSLCTSSCYSSLQSHRANVTSQCANYPFLDSLTDTFFLPTILDGS